MAPKTNAERQRDYRARRRAEQGAPLSLWLSKDAHEALAHLAKQRGKTRQDVVEGLVLLADRIARQEVQP